MDERAPPAPATRGPGPSEGIGRIEGRALELSEFRAETVTNRQFAGFDLERLDRFFLPDPLLPLVDAPALGRRTFVEDDNRSAIDPTPVATLDGLPFYLSVKGIGSDTEPFSFRPLDRPRAAELTEEISLHERLASAPDTGGGIITGEVWLRGSPYGGQGLPHAETALRVSERADLTDLHGFRLAPVVKIAFLPETLEERLRSIYWYRRYRGRFVQELRLVPSNVRFFFHDRPTVGHQIGAVFDLFAVDTPAKAHLFELNFLKSGLAFLTLFARTLERDPATGRWAGLDFYDVWLDKDAVIAPDGTVFFVDLEGLETVRLEASDVPEKFEDQIYRSLYEFMFAYEQIDGEVQRRFGRVGSRRRRLEALLEQAVRTDPFVRLTTGGASTILEVRPPGFGERLIYRFPLVDHSRGEL